MTDQNRRQKYWRSIERHRPDPDRIERPGPGQESVWDYPRPPRIEPVTLPLRVEHAGTVIAETTAGLRVVETAGAPVYYFPPSDVTTSLLRPSPGSSVCEWKGTATYWAVAIDGDIVKQAAWSYPSPNPDFEDLKDYVAFYAQKMDACYIGDERVAPQPGRFYGGWLTSNILGPIKGEPGSELW